jgi:post-segregation antitoxin (ccd killing protein)
VEVLVDITVYLPNRLGDLARAEGINFSGLLRDAVTEELRARGIAWDDEFVSKEVATQLIREELEDGEWHKRRDLDEKFGSRIRDAHFGHAKKVLGIEHHHFFEAGDHYVSWRLPSSEVDDA